MTNLLFLLYGAIALVSITPTFSTTIKLASGSDFMKNVSFPIKPILQQTAECEVAQYARKAGFSESAIPVMVCISKYESTFSCNANNKNNDGSTDYGLFQINSYYWCSGDPASRFDECHASCASLYDCQRNANCAYTVWRQQGFTAWYGYQYHKSECDNYKINC
jgi:lysozyme C